jgi:hypothetical protein
MRLIEKERRTWHTFDSVEDFIETLIDPTLHRDSVPHLGIDGISWNIALELVKTGWPEGRKRLEQVQVDVMRSVTGQLPVPELVWDVAGDSVDMGRFVQGEPETFMSLTDTEQLRDSPTGRIIHVVVNVDASGGIAGDSIFWRGAAGVVLVDTLERMGRRVIVDAIANTESRTGELLETRIRLKEADQALNLDRLTFLCCHHSILRNLLFESWDRLPPATRNRYFGKFSYGSPGAVPEEDRGDLYIDRLLFDEKSTTSIHDWVTEQLKQQGIHLANIGKEE